MGWQAYFALLMPLATCLFLAWLFRRDWYRPKR
jgi:hypothetical protein